MSIFSKKSLRFLRSTILSRKDCQVDKDLEDKFIKLIDDFNELQLQALSDFLDFEDDIILNFYNHNVVKKNIDQNEISKIFKKFKI